MPDKITPQEALAQLGDTQESAINKLRELQIKGRARDVCDCPFAVYFKQLCDIPPGFMVYRTGIAKPSEDPVNRKKEYLVIFPHHIQEAIRSIDGDRALDLCQS